MHRARSSHPSLSTRRRRQRRFSPLRNRPTAVPMQATPSTSMTQLRTQPISPEFVIDVLKRSRTTTSVFQTALCYIAAIRSRIPDLAAAEAAGCGPRGTDQFDHIVLAVSVVQVKEEIDDADAMPPPRQSSSGSLVRPVENCAQILLCCRRRRVCHRRSSAQATRSLPHLSSHPSSSRTGATRAVRGPNWRDFLRVKLDVGSARSATLWAGTFGSPRRRAGIVPWQVACQYPTARAIARAARSRRSCRVCGHG